MVQPRTIRRVDGRNAGKLGPQGRMSVLFLLAMVALAGCTADAVAQGANATRSATVGVAWRSGDPVILVVRPRVGDTLHLQMEQTIESSGRTADASATVRPGVLDGVSSIPSPRTPEVGPRRGRTALRVQRLQLFAHSIVEASTINTTTLLATTDSMAMWSGAAVDVDSMPPMQPKRIAMPLESRQVRVRVTTDGAMRMHDPPPSATELGSTLAAMPGMLPEGAVRVGDTWERDIPLPSLPVSGLRADGVVRARFRLDSLTHRGRDAWISLDGILRRDGAARDLPPGTRVITAGTMLGILVVDRDRAWIVDARTVIDVRSDVSPGPSGSTPASPVLLDIRIRQHMHVK